VCSGSAKPFFVWYSLFLSPPRSIYLVLVLYTPSGNASFLLFKWVWLVVHAWVCLVVMAMFVYERYV